MNILKKLISHPLTKGMDIDDPKTTLLRKKIIQEKFFLRKIYYDWYKKIFDSLPNNANNILELGSGAGFFKSIVKNTITSEIFLIPGIDLVADACKLPFSNGALDSIVMTDVFHHIPDVKLFLSEAERTLRAGGKIIMIEPWNTPWARFIYCNLHSEPFIPDTPDWVIQKYGPLSGANGALPWIVFNRDRANFNKNFPKLKIIAIEPMMPFIYLFSGGVSMRSLLPSSTYNFIRYLENFLDEKKWGMFAFIEIEHI